MNKISALTAMLLLATSAFAADVTVSVGGTSEIIRTSDSTVSLKGAASGAAKVTWQTSNGATGTASGTEAWEAASIPVAEGNTTIIIKAFDALGGSSWVAIVAVRQPAAQPVVISSTFSGNASGKCGICQ